MTNNRRTNNPKDVPNKIVNDTKNNPVFKIFMKDFDGYTKSESKNKNKNEGRENNISRNARSTFYRNNSCTFSR